jgi:hypothetical protein
MNANLALQTVSRYCCARCWGHLLAIPGDDGGLHPTCARRLNDECDGKGYVTKSYADKRRQASMAELMEVYANYPQLAPIRRHVTVDQVLSELGI